MVHAQYDFVIYIEPVAIFLFQFLVISVDNSLRVVDPLTGDPYGRFRCCSPCDIYLLMTILFPFQFPVISVDNYLPIVDPLTGAQFGQIKVLLAM